MSKPGALAFASLLALSLTCHAQIKLGVSGPLEGSNAGSMLEVLKGAEIYVNHVNGQGGIGGQKIQIVARHDNFEVDKTVAVVKRLIEEDNVTALLLVRGTPHNQAILPLVNQYKVPLIGPSTGAMIFHKPIQKYVFNVRTAYQLEAEKLVRLLKTSGHERIAVLHVADAFGLDVMTGLKSGFIDANIQPTIVQAFDRALAAKDATDFMKPLLDSLLKSDPQVVVVVGAGLAVKNAVVAIREAGSQAKIATLSNNASTAFIKLLDKNGRGVIVSQVFPDEKSLTSPFVREAQILAGANKVTLTPGMMEGFAAAKVTVKALRDAGGNPTRDSVTRALEAMRSYDLGDLVIGYSPLDHTGLEMTDLSMISPKGFLR